MGRLIKEMPVKRFYPSMYSLTISGLCSKCLTNINRRKKRLDKKKKTKPKAVTDKGTAVKEKGKGTTKEKKKTN